jgi:hypothetical protein
MVPAERDLGKFLGLPYAKSCLTVHILKGSSNLIAGCPA